MARYVVHVRTDWSPQEAFDFMADLRNFAAWDPGVAKVVQVDGDGAGEGSAFDVDVNSVGGTTTLRYRTVEFDEPHRVVVRATNRLLTSFDIVEVTPDGDGAVVTYDAELTLNGVLRLADPLLALAFGRIGDRAADGLIEALAGERTTEPVA